MMFIALEPITGVALGIEYVGMGEVDDDFRYVIIELLVIRFVISWIRD
jgi:hypothetical protein